MAGDTTITVIGNLTADPELRFTPSGAGVVNFTIASTPRTLDRATNEWKDGQTLFLRCNAWRNLADNITDSLKKGTRVIAQGNLTQRSYQAQDGTNRTVYELSVNEIGPSLRNATAQVTRKSSTANGGFNNASTPAQSQSAPASPVNEDPWADSLASDLSDPADVPF
jgi:single-strand DNA-binding protein